MNLKYNIPQRNAAMHGAWKRTTRKTEHVPNTILHVSLEFATFVFFRSSRGFQYFDPSVYFHTARLRTETCVDIAEQKINIHLRGRKTKKTKIKTKRRKSKKDAPIERQTKYSHLYAKYVLHNVLVYKKHTYRMCIVHHLPTVVRDAKVDTYVPKLVYR